MNIRHVLRRCAGAGMLVAAALVALPVQTIACTQVYVGSEHTTTGDTYVGRSEDYAPQHAKAFGVQEPRTNPTYTSQESDFSRTFTGTTFRYTYVRDLASDWDGHDFSYSEAGANERGVSVSATLSTDYNDGIAAIDPLCNPDNPQGNTAGIGEYTLTDVVLGEAATAREGCLLLGQIIDQYGACECNQVIIADSGETWLFQMLSGHQWLALKMGAHDVSVNPNMGNLQFKVDLDDETVCLHSADVVKMPQEAGLLKTFDDGTPNIAATYGEANSGPGQNTRYAQGRAYFGAPLAAGTDFTVNEKGQVASIADPQLSFAPGMRVDTFTALRSLAARGEQQEGLNANLNQSLYAIGNNRTVENHIFQIRSGLPAEIATVQWTALSRAEFSLFLPSYSAVLTEVDQAYYPQSTEFSDAHQGKQTVDSVEQALEPEPGQAFDYVMMDINTLAYNNRVSCAAGVRGYLDALQRSIIAQQERVDQIVQAAPADRRSQLANTLFAQVTEQSYTKCKAMLDELRTYIKAGDTSEAFVPSDFDAESGAVKTPLLYAAAVVAPKIVTQPASLRCEQGAGQVAVSVEATSDDATAGTDGLLRYQWFRRASAEGDFEAMEGETSSAMSVDTSHAGETVYRVEVTNAAGLTTVSDEATVAVTAKQQVDAGGTSGSTATPAKPDRKRTGPGAHLPATGEGTAALAALAAVGSACAVAGVRRRRRA